MRRPIRACIRCPHFAQYSGYWCPCVHPETLDHRRWWVRAWYRFLARLEFI